MLNSLPPKKYGVKIHLPDSHRIILVWFYTKQDKGIRAIYKNHYWHFARSNQKIKGVTHWAEV